MGHKPIIVNGVADHVHLFIGLKPSISISNLVRDVKRSSSLFINEQKWLRTNFRWQEGYGVFSYSKSHIENVYHYIKNQENHHMKKTFEKEYLNFLKEYDIEFDEKFLFKFFD